MSRVHVNNVQTSITTAVSSSGTSMIIASSTGFPTLGSNVMYLTLAAGGLYEIVKVTSRSSLTLTVVRAQEGTTGLAWAAGTTISCRFTAAGMDNKIDMGDESLLTIATGVVTATNGFHKIDTESAAATDDLDTINGGVVGMLLTITATSSARDVVLKDGTGNLKLAGDCTLDNVEDTITLIYSSVGTCWKEICRSNNGA